MLHLFGTAERGRGARRRAARSRRRKGRPRPDLHADGAGSRLRHARRRPPRRGPFRGLRRLRRPRACHPHRRLPSEGGCRRLLRHRAVAPGSLQAAARRRHRAGEVQARPLPRAGARGTSLRSGARPRHRLCGRRLGAYGSGHEGALRPRRRDRPALHPLHLRHDRPAQGRRARQWRPHGRPALLDEGALRHRAGRGLLGRLRCRLGRRPFLHRLCAADPRRDDPSSSRASPSARPTPAPSGGSSRTTASRRSSPRRPPSAPSRRKTRPEA